MRRPLETARRWLAEAEHSLTITGVMFEGGFWAKVCFESEQTSQLALKAFLYSKGRRTIPIHSIGDLIAECGKEDQRFLELRNRGIVLDKYYLSTRYPDALPSPAIPYESFTEDEAVQALGIATDIVDSVKAMIPWEDSSSSGA